MKIVSIVGARPQFIKSVIVSKEIRKKHEEILVHTGQHYDYEMNKIFFNELGISKPVYNLGVGSASQGKQTGDMLIKIEKVLLKEKPNIVLVYGDTNSTLAGALASSKIHIPVGHIEAGLRSFDKTMPEEVNRILTDHSSDYLFAPTKTSVINLKNEGIQNGVYQTGDVMFDALINNLELAKKSNILEEIGIISKDYFLATIHRQSNTDNAENLANIIDAFSSSNEKIVFPIHPRTEKFLKNHGLKERIRKNILLIKPVGYLDFICLQKNAKKILTDSGGIQKEAYILDVPCITLRENTEWVETVEDGWNILVGSDKEKILDSISKFRPKGKKSNIFGDGKAGKNIVRILNQNVG